MNDVLEDPIILDMVNNRRKGLSTIERLVENEVVINQNLIKRMRYSLDLLARRMDLWGNDRLYLYHKSALSSLMNGLLNEDKGLVILLLTKSFELVAIENRFEEKIEKCKTYKGILRKLYELYVNLEVQQRWMAELDKGYELQIKSN